MVGARYHGQAESIPIASLGKIKVVTVDYRMAPEHHFPAASEDVAAVYKALLQHYRPGNIGIYGCSAGALLTAEAVAWFEKEHLPLPGAVAMFGEGAGRRFGDSNYFASALNGATVPGIVEGKNEYLSSGDPTDPLKFPADSVELLKRFPPALLISGTRDLALSDVIYTDTQLTKAGAASELHVWDGMGHCFVVDTDAPETRDAWQVIIRFFDRHLGR
jgi:acetyl esterase/lipase